MTLGSGVLVTAHANDLYHFGPCIFFLGMVARPTGPVSATAVIARKSLLPIITHRSQVMHRKCVWNVFDTLLA